MSYPREQYHRGIRSPNRSRGEYRNSGHSGAGDAIRSPNRNRTEDNYRGRYHDNGMNRGSGGGGYRGSYEDRGSRGGAFGRGRGSGGRGRGPLSPAKPHVLCGEGAVFKIDVQKGRKAFRYDVSMDFTSNRPGAGLITTSLTTEKRDTRMRALCYRILSLVLDATNNFGIKGLQIVYDNQNTLYSPRPFDPISYTVTKNQLPTELQRVLKGNGEIHISISPNAEMEYINLDDVTQYTSGEILWEEDQTVRQVLEIILTQGALDSGDYDVVGNGQLYRTEELQIGRGLCTRIGTQKGIRMIEDNGDGLSPEQKKVVPALVVDFKRSPFHSVGRNLLDMVLEFVNGDRNNPRVWEEASKFFHNVSVVPVYDLHRVLKIDNFDNMHCDEISITLDNGTTISLPQFYQTIKHRPLQQPHTRAVNIAGDKGQFPMELLLILPHQRCNLEKVPSHLRDQVHKQNAVSPQERYTNIMKEVYNMDFNNEVTKAFGISVSYKAAENARVLEFLRPPKPDILAGNGVRRTPNEDGRFDLRNFLYECDKETINAFITAFKSAASKYGISVVSPPKLIHFQSSQATFQHWHNMFLQLNEQGTTFAVLVDTKQNARSHELLKLMEAITKLLTQHITLEVARKVAFENQTQTLGNILLKINVKNGGINYKPEYKNAGVLDVNSGNVLVIGYDVAHPTGVLPEKRRQNIEDGHQSETQDPSVVGITANVLSDPCDFAGDFFYQPTRQEKVDKQELRIYVRRLIEKLKTNRSKLPEIVVILRDGVSEGQFKMTYDEEFPAIRQGFSDSNPDYKPKFVFVICTKRHHKRFFEGQNKEFRNPMAGSFVQGKFTRPDCPEFFMQCHNAIKGTAKFVQVCVIVNEANVEKKDLFGFLHSLSYGHQIVCSPVSLPTPIYQADELAARGFEIYHTLKAYNPNSIKWQNGEIRYFELSQLLNYGSSSLSDRRFNA